MSAMEGHMGYMMTMLRSIASTSGLPIDPITGLVIPGEAGDEAGDGETESIDEDDSDQD